MIRRSWPLICLLLLTGCQPRLDVRLASDAERIPNPGFVVSEEGQARPRYTTIQVLRVEDRSVVWHLRAEPFGDQNSVAEFQYGVAPDRFTSVVAAEVLEVGTTYAAVVSGQGRGEVRFEVRPGGEVVKVE